jgi:hypothetical protein
MMTKPSLVSKTPTVPPRLVNLLTFPRTLLRLPALKINGSKTVRPMSPALLQLINPGIKARPNPAEKVVVRNSLRFIW